MDRPALPSVLSNLENVQLLKEELQTSVEGTEILIALRHMLSVPLIGSVGCMASRLFAEAVLSTFVGTAP